MRVWCNWQTVSVPSGASNQPLIGAEQATGKADGLDIVNYENAMNGKDVTSAVSSSYENL